jgi:hypothetical protein
MKQRRLEHNTPTGIKYKKSSLLCTPYFYATTGNDYLLFFFSTGT